MALATSASVAISLCGNDPMQLNLNRTQIIGALLLAGTVLLILLVRYWNALR